MPRIKLLLVDDHEIVRAGLRMLFKGEPDMEIAGEAASAVQALELLHDVPVDVVLMDIAMAGMSGIEATRRIKAVRPDVAVIALTMHEDEQYFFQMLDAGASGYVPKRAAADELVSAIRSVQRGEVYIYPTMTKLLVRDFLERGEGAASGQAVRLTPREREVLTLIAEGHSNREIAGTLVISPKTVDRHQENIMRKLDLHSRVDLVKYAIEQGLITLG